MKKEELAILDKIQYNCYAMAHQHKPVFIFWMTGQVLAGSDYSVAYWQPWCAHQLSVFVPVLKRLSSTFEWRLQTTKTILPFLLQFPSTAFLCTIMS
jgi:hypothetical protein